MKDTVGLPTVGMTQYMFNYKEGEIGILFRVITNRRKAELDLKERTEQLEHTQKKLEENACRLEEYSNQMEELANQRLAKLKDSERLAAIGARQAR